MLYDKIKQEETKNVKTLKQLKMQIRQLPPGYFSAARNGNYIKWYQVKPKKRIYIRKKNKSLAQALAQKNYLMAKQQDLEHEQKAIRSFLKHYQNYHSKQEEFLKHQVYQELLSEALRPISAELSEWATASYEKNPSHPENLKYKSISENYVRSKSEMLIEQALFFHQIPYRYECKLMLGEISMYPDFTIRHPRTGAEIYWEHFGMMDLPAYSGSAYHKLQTYGQFGYYPTINLISTFETKENPLDVDTIEKVIEWYLT